MSIRPAIATTDGTPPLPINNKAEILELGRRLATFKSTKELLCVFASDAADPHQQALDKANILYGDVISPAQYPHHRQRVSSDGDLNAPARFNVVQLDTLMTAYSSSVLVVV
ncbi:hypothetical protein M378DRAFT_15527 [Amanita muscaria Koide BX008]|uniref:Uncharacterized protein n=1 Tax=Amanita muscaria (strain Koide BX008) TaxID=946122 RepID=A0A0C2S6V8_AMAMK|nr:hypothetical protein M378DRAFT_15527 [Amanita muscaria Koide BX008]